MREKQAELSELRCEIYIRTQELRKKWQNFKENIYNPKTKKIFGRTRASWWQLTLFYLVFMISLTAMFTICLYSLFATLSERKSNYILGDSLMGTKPGLGLRPISPNLQEGSLIRYSMENNKSIEKFTDLLDDFLSPYNNQTAHDFMNCDFRSSAGGNKVCRVNMDQFGNCTKSKSKYGYLEGEPCVFIKLNEIFGWKPDCYYEPQPDMPPDLKRAIVDIKELERCRIWVSCTGQNTHDQEAIGGISHHPPGFASYYYPYIDDENYLSPLVAVQIHKPKRNILINIECRAWAKNIIYYGGEVQRQGSVRFELMIEGPDDTDSTTMRPKGVYRKFGNEIPYDL